MRTLKYLWNRLTEWAHREKPKTKSADAHNALDDARHKYYNYKKCIEI